MTSNSLLPRQPPETHIFTWYFFQSGQRKTLTRVQEGFFLFHIETIQNIRQLLKQSLSTMELKVRVWASTSLYNRTFPISASFPVQRNSRSLITLRSCPSDSWQFQRHFSASHLLGWKGISVRAVWMTQCSEQSPRNNGFGALNTVTWVDLVCLIVNKKCFQDFSFKLNANLLALWLCSRNSVPFGENSSNAR